MADANNPLAGSMFDLDTMSEGGALWGSGDGVDCLIDRMWVQPWRHSGEKDYGVKCAVAIHYSPSEDGIPEHTDYVSVGDLKEWAPSNDGTTPVALPDNIHELTAKPEDAAPYSGPKIAYVGEKSGGVYNKGSKWAQWYAAAKLAGVPPPTSDSLADFVRGGIRCHVSRIAQKGAKANDKGRIPDILVITRFDGFVGQGGGGGSVAPAAVSGAPNAGQSAAMSAAVANSGDFSDLHPVALELVAAAENMTLSKKDFTSQLFNRFIGNGQAVKHAADFVNSLPALMSIPGLKFDSQTQAFTIG